MVCHSVVWRLVFLYGQDLRKVFLISHCGPLLCVVCDTVLQLVSYPTLLSKGIGDCPCFGVAPTSELLGLHRTQYPCTLMTLKVSLIVSDLLNVVSWHSRG